MKNPRTGSGIALTVTVTALCLTALSPAYASPTPTPTPAASTAPSAAATTQSLVAPLKYQLSLRGQRQQTNYYCVPASASMSLSTFGISVSQPTLAKKMKTTPSGGTKRTNALPVVSAYVRSRGYKYTVPADTAGNSFLLMSRVANNVGQLHRAPLLGVWMEQLPWNKGKVKGTKVGHAIIAYGYDKMAGTITVYDPWKPTGGTHTITASTLAGILQPGGMYYISKL
ncbi:C39 family peptidase [Nonomuraea sp. CA-141351]|uniref:C39 family peptidase n=1 Tax=Nonomuraea sp. CA-141351 TaxID=3239996 RepID=UPI003D9460D2